MNRSFLLVVLSLVGAGVLGQACSQWPSYSGSVGISGTVHWFASDYYYYSAVPGSLLKIVLTRSSSFGDPDLYVSRDSVDSTPGWLSYEYKSETSGDEDIVQFRVPASSQPFVCYAIAVFGFTPSSYTLTFLSSEDNEADHPNNPDPVEVPSFPAECSGPNSFSSVDSHSELFTVPDGESVYFYYTATLPDPFEIEVFPFSGDPDLFVTKAAASLYPSYWNADYLSYYTSETGVDKVTIDPEIVPMCYAIGIYGWTESTFVLNFTVVPEVYPSECDTAITEFGAIPGSVGHQQTNYYYFKASRTPTLDVTLSVKSGDPDMFISKASRNARPSSGDHDFNSVEDELRDEVVYIPIVYDTEDSTACYAIAVYGYSDASYELIFRNGTYDPDAIDHLDEMPDECNGDRSITGTTSTVSEAVDWNSYVYWYYRIDSTQFNSLRIRLETETGDADLLVGFAALGVTPTFASYQFNDIESGLVPENIELALPSQNATICYAIGIFGSAEDTTFHLEFQPYTSSTPEPIPTPDETPESVEVQTETPDPKVCSGTLGGLLGDGSIYTGSIEFEDQSIFFQYSSASGKFSIEYTGRVRVFVTPITEGLPSSNNYIAKGTTTDGRVDVSGDAGCFNLAIESRGWNVDFTVKIIEGGSSSTYVSSTVARDVSIGILIPLGALAAGVSFVYYRRKTTQNFKFTKLDKNDEVEETGKSRGEVSKLREPTFEVTDLSDGEDPQNTTIV